MNLDTAIRAVIGQDAAEDRVLAVARVLAERGEREPMPAAIESAALAAREARNEAEDGGPIHTPSELAAMKQLPGRERSA